MFSCCIGLGLGGGGGGGGGAMLDITTFVVSSFR